MAKKTKDEILASVRALLGDNSNTDSAISLYEDITDSFATDDEDWKSKYEENDKMWRDKYSSRFFEPSKTTENEINQPKSDNEESPLSLDDLFEESEE